MQRRHLGGGGGERYDNSPTSKIYTTWAHILSDHNVFCTLRGRGKTVGSNAPGAFLVIHGFFWYTLNYIPFRKRFSKQIHTCLGDKSRHLGDILK